MHPGNVGAGQLSGLTSGEVLARRAQFGENRLPEEAGVSVWNILLNQLKSPLVYIIGAASVISLLLGELSDFTIIMVVLVADVILGFVQEYQARQTYIALKGLLKPHTTVVRDGQRHEIEVWELVPDDLVLLATGDKIPADGELIETIRLALDEAILTGESEPVTKHADGEVPLAGASTSENVNDVVRQTRVYMGSTVVTGRGLMRVTATGSRSELGQISASLAGQDEQATPLQVRLMGFSKALTWVVVATTVIILGVGLLTGQGFLEMLRISIILAIAAVPEGLIIAVTVILVLGMRKILKRNGLVKQLLAVETLGSVTVICTDKTGTLTEGRMRVNRADLADQERALQTMVLCNNLEGAVDIALWEYAEKNMPSSPQLLFDSSQRLGEELFTSETKYMIAAVTANVFDGQKYFFLKGASEIVLGMCNVDDAERGRILGEADDWASAGLRLLGFAYRRDGVLEDHSGYTWVGLVGMEDPVRQGVSEAVQVAQSAGIKIKMLTGDYQRTAESIARSIGLPVTEAPLEGTQIAAMPDDELRQRVRATSVFARIRPRDKSRIIRALQADGEVTAMIGDGVNDAPALMHADIGVVVGSATDVAKETADLILLDDNFRTVVAAVEEGRVIYDNIRKVIAYILSNSFAEMLIVFIAMILGWPAPLTIAQILWINLVCDGPSDIVLGFEPKEDGIMDARPRSRTEPLLDSLTLALIVVISGGAAFAGLFLFGYFHLVLDSPVEGRSIVFAALAIIDMVYIFAFRSLRTPLFRMHPPTANKPLLVSVSIGFIAALLPFWIPDLGDLLGVVPLSLMEWGWVSGFAIAVLAFVEAAKAISRRVHRSPNPSGQREASST